MKSKLAQKELEALSPGESTLLRHLHRLKKPATLRTLSKLPDFHGWDHGSLEMLIDSLKNMGMVSWDGKMVSPLYRTAEALIPERVVDRFVKDL
jgi:hypothetical protein